MSDPIKAVRDAFRGTPSRPVFVGSYAEPAYVSTAKLIVASIGSKADGDRTETENRAVHDALDLLQNYMEEQKAIREEVNARRDNRPMDRDRIREAAEIETEAQKQEAEQRESAPVMSRNEALKIAARVWGAPGLEHLVVVPALTRAFADILQEQSKVKLPSDLTLVGKKELEETELQAKRYQQIRERVDVGVTGVGRSLGNTNEVNVAITFKQGITARELHRLLLGLELDGSVPEKKPEPEAPTEAGTPPIGFEKELEHLLNRYSKENGSDTPDFLLATYLIGCLENFNAVVVARRKWYGSNDSIVQDSKPTDRLTD